MKIESFFKKSLLLLIPLIFSFIACTPGDSGYVARSVGSFEIRIDGRGCAVSESKTVTLSGKIYSSDYEDSQISVYLTSPNANPVVYLDFSLACEGHSFENVDGVFLNSIESAEYESVSRSFSVSFPNAGEFWLVVEVTATDLGAKLTPVQQIFPIRVSDSVE